MGNISIKDNELVALLPKHLRESSELKGAAKLILGDLMFLNNRDFAKENGFVFRTNQDLMNDTGIKGESTLIKALAKLEIEGFINRTSGKRNKASEYRLNMDKIKDKHTVTEIHSNNENNNLSVSDSNLSKTETDVMNSRLESIENLWSTKLDTMIEILNKINSNNNEIITQIKTIYTQINGINRNFNLSVSDSNLSTDKETESHKESSNNILHIDISSITSEEIDHLDNFLKKKIIKEKTKYMKDNKISRPDVNVVVNSVNNAMNNNTKNNNSTPDHQHTDTTVSPTSESHSHNECTVPSVDGKNNNIQPLQVPASDTSDTSTVLLSGDDGIGGMVPSVEENNIQPVQVRTSDTSDTPTVYASGNEGMEVVSDSTNSESTATNGIDTTHTTSEDNTIPTVNGTETLQHPAYSSAKPSKIYAKKGAAAVGGDFGAAQKSCETASNTPTVEQLPTATEKVDNSRPLDSDTASNGEFDMYYAQYGCTREEYEEIQRSFHKSNWRSLPCKFNGKELTMSKVIDKFNEEYEEGKQPIETNTYFFIYDTLEKYAQHYERIGKMSQADTDDYLDMIRKKSGRYFAYWTKTFENRRPYEARPSEKRMYDLLVQMGRIGEKQLEKTDITSIPTVNTVDTDFEDEMAYLDFESGTMTKKHSTTA